MTNEIGPSAFPLNLTSKQRKKLAKAARELAFECAAGGGPAMDDHWGTWTGACGCAAHHVLARAGLVRIWDNFRPRALERVLSGDEVMPEDGILSEASRLRANGTEPTAVVFPLLALADELEAVPPKANKPLVQP